MTARSADRSPKQTPYSSNYRNTRVIPVHLHAQGEVCFGKPALSKAPSERKHVSEKVFPKKCFRTSISEQDPTPQDPSGLEVRGRYFQLVSASLLACCPRQVNRPPRGPRKAQELSHLASNGQKFPNATPHLKTLRVWVVGTFSLYLEPCWHVAWRRFLNFLNAPKFPPELPQHGSKMGQRWPQAGPGQLQMALR